MSSFVLIFSRFFHDFYFQYWDPNIAVIAQYFADSCPTYPTGHDKLRNVPGLYSLYWNFFIWKTFGELAIGTLKKK